MTGRRAYLDRGRRDGLRVGVTVELERQHRRTPCRIERVAEQAATCIGNDVRLGATFSMDAPAEGSPPQPVRTLPPVAKAELLARERVAIEQASYAKVDRGERAPHPRRGLPIVEAAVGFATWNTFSSQDGTYTQEHVHLSLMGAELPFLGLRAYARLDATHFSTLPATARFRPTETTRFDVWEAELVSRQLGNPYAFSLGRIWPYHAPGLVALDGAQAGWRNRQGSLEVGGFGGGLPDPATLDPSFDRWIGGAYVAATQSGEKSSFLQLVREEARLAVRNAPGLGTKTDAEVQVQAYLARGLDLGMSGRFVLASGWPGPTVEAVRAHVGLAPTARWRLFASVRRQAPLTVDDTGLGLSPFGVAGFTAGTLDGTLHATDWLSLTATTGLYEDATTGQGRFYAGPELGLPRLLGSVGGTSVGYLEELGFLAGRTAHVQFFLLPTERLRLLARLSFFEDRATGSAAPSRELGAHTHLELRLFGNLRLRATAMTRVGISEASGESGPSRPIGLVLRTDLAASF